MTKTTVKLWNMDRVDKSFVNKTVLFKNLEVDIYKERPQLKSTGQTKLVSVLVVHICFDVNEFEIKFI